MNQNNEKAILAGGCFWGMQELIRHLDGVISTRVGYTGDNTLPNATYRNHGDHAEAVEVIFDPTILPYEKLLAFFFQIHNPSTLDRQGNDKGRSYRSEIFYTNDAQKATAQEIMRKIDTSGKWESPVVTKLTPAGAFWEAEAEHQDYLQHNPHGYTCHFIRPEWTLD